jgi:hypothetical protein
MSDADNARLMAWLGIDIFLIRIFDNVSDEMRFSSLNTFRYGQSTFQALCMDAREDELLLDVVGCLDAPL